MHLSVSVYVLRCVARGRESEEAIIAPKYNLIAIDTIAMVCVCVSVCVSVCVWVREELGRY